MGVHQPPRGANPAGYRADIRQHLFEVLCAAGRPLSTVELARRAGVPRDKVALRGMQYPLQRLADAGLVEVTRSGRGQHRRNTYRAITADVEASSGGVS